MQNREELRDIEPVVKNDPDDKSRNTNRGKYTGQYHSKNDLGSTKTTEDYEKEAEQYAPKGTKKYYSKLFDLTVAEPFFESKKENTDFVLNYFRKENIKVLNLKRNENKYDDLLGCDYYLIAPNLPKKYQKQVFDLKTKIVNDVDFNNPTIEMHILKTMVDKDGNLRINENNEPELFDEFLFLTNKTHYYLYNLINSDKQIEKPEDVQKNKMYILEKDAINSYSENTIGSIDEVKNICSNLLKTYNDVKQINVIGYSNGALELKDGIKIVKKYGNYELHKKFDNGITIKCVSNSDYPKTCDFYYSFNPEEIIPKITKDKNYKYDSGQSKQIASSMGLNENDVKENTSKEKTLNSIGLNSKDVKQKEANEQQQAEKLFGLGEEESNGIFK